MHGSSDALLIAQLSRARRPLAVFTATAADAQRLLEEIPFFDPGIKVHLLPDWETLPYDQFSPHQDLVSERLATLYQLMQRAFDVAIVPVTTALYRLTPVEYLAARSFFFKQGEKLAPDELRRQLVTAGYTHVTQVMAPGEYCVRGGLIDLFPMGSALPYRIEFDDEVVESIRSFDVDSQRSIYKVNEVRLLPAREFPHGRGGPDALPPRVPREIRRRSLAQPRLQGRVQGRAQLPASSTTCRCSSTRPRSSPITCRQKRCSACNQSAAGDRAVLDRHPRALRHAARRPRPPRPAAARPVPDHR